MKIADFSVLMSVYYKEKPQFLKKALQSIDNQELFPSQIVIIKDGPLTNSLNLLLDNYKVKHPQVVTLVVNDRNRGLAFSLQRGLEFCRNNIVARADSDDINYFNRFFLEFDFLQTHPLISAVGCQIEEYDPKIGKTRNKNVPITSAKIYRYAKKRNPLNHMSVMFRKKDILAVNGYEQVSLFEDYYLWVKLLKRGYKLYNLPMNLIRATTDSGFYSRRGGFGYFKREYRFQLLAYSLSFTSKYEFLRNVLVRTCMRLFPPNALQFIYEKILRNNN